MTRDCKLLKFIDYLPTGNSLQQRPDALHKIFVDTYDINLTFHDDIFLGLNLQWPNFDLPGLYEKFILSFHTEFLDWIWVIRQAEKIYPKQILLITDLQVTGDSICPDNVTVLRWITIHKQLALLVKLTDINHNPKLPSYKISSLSNRVSQYKNFVTAYLMDNFPRDDMILTHHARLMKSEDAHDHPVGHPHLDKLDLSKLSEKIILNFDDKFIGKSPVANGDWKNSAYLDALINFTNESFHYSKTIIKDQDTCWPGPYITEKTFKPLLAGRPFVCVGQSHTYEFLQQLGFRSDFGFDISFDQDPGDLTRINGIFRCIDQIRDLDLTDLYDASIDAVMHNAKWIIDGHLQHRCQDLNKQNIHKLLDFLEI